MGLIFHLKLIAFLFILRSIISVNEFTLNVQEVNAFTFSTLESYLPLAAGCLLLTLPLSLRTKGLKEKYMWSAPTAGGRPMPPSLPLLIWGSGVVP